MAKKLRKFFSGYWKTIIVAGIILYASLLREPRFSLPTLIHGDKWMHMLSYALLGAMAWWDSTSSGNSGWKRTAIAIVFPILYGGIIEWLQELWFYPRTSDWIDWAADSIGVLIGCAITVVMYNTTKRKKDDSRMAQ